MDIYPAYADLAYRIHFWGDEIEALESFDPLNGYKIDKFDQLRIFPANIFVASKDRIQNAIHQIQDDLVDQVNFLNQTDRKLEAKRLDERVNYDLEMIRELGIALVSKTIPVILTEEIQVPDPFVYSIISQMIS